MKSKRNLTILLLFTIILNVTLINAEYGKCLIRCWNLGTDQYHDTYDYRDRDACTQDYARRVCGSWPGAGIVGFIPS